MDMLLYQRPIYGLVSPITHNQDSQDQESQDKNGSGMIIILFLVIH